MRDRLNLILSAAQVVIIIVLLAMLGWLALTEPIIRT